LAENEVIDGVPCARWRFWSVLSGGGGTHFHPNGHLKQATLSEDFEIEGRPFTNGAVVEFDPQGRLVATGD